jgi:hypothetical protein
MCPHGDRPLRPARALAGALALLALLAAEAAAQTPPSPPKPGRQEESRRKLLEQLGLDKKETPPRPTAPDRPAEPAPPARGEPGAPAPGPGGSGERPSPPAAAVRAGLPFGGSVHETLLAACRPCHAAGGLAAATRLVLDGNVGRDHAAARRLIDTASPRRSLLLTKATGAQHGGGPTIAATSEVYQRLLRWVADGGVLRAPPSTAVPSATDAVPERRPRPRPAGRAPRPGIAGGTAAGAGRSPATPPAPPTGAATAPATPASPPATPASPPSAPAAPGTPPAAEAETATAPPGGTPAPPADAPSATALHRELVLACVPCHRVGAPGGATRFRLSGDLTPDLTASRAFVDPDLQTGSVLVTKAAGESHGGGAPWPADSAGHRALVAWIASGTPTGSSAPDGPQAGPPAGPPGATPLPPGSGPAPTAGAQPAPEAGGAARTGSAPAAAGSTPTPVAPAAPPAGGPASRPRGLALFGDTLALNGRFDLNLERRTFATNPWADASTTAIQSYHHFLFLSRQSAEDPFTFTAELISLEFFEAGLRFRPRARSWRVHVRVGKLLVPFGNEPLLHQNYGGHAGFDQRVLPVVWAAEGLAASTSLDVAGLTLSADLYGVRGHGLRRPDAVLNLQNDFSPLDDAHPALGLRLGGAWGPLSAFYSAYFNPLGHDRRLFLQAADVTAWRWPDLPVLDRLVLGAGLLRADVSGGGAGLDYYHFASYWLARFYILDGLTLQYRQGLRTFDNKRNLIFDARRSGREDGSTHNLSLGARYRGLSAALTYYINLEKADEVDDDLLRLTVAFDF